MKNINFITLFLIFFMMISLSGCDVVYGIFEVGVWAGIIIVVLVIVLIGWLIKKMID